MKRQMSLLVGVLLAIVLCWHASIAMSTPDVDTTVYKVVYPLGNSSVPVKPLAARLPDLNGKTICELWNHMFRGEVTFPKIRELLRKQYPRVKFIPYTELPNTHGPDEAKMITTLADLLLKKGCNAVISGNGG